MKEIKRILALLCAVSMFIFLLSACSKKDSFSPPSKGAGRSNVDGSVSGSDETDPGTTQLPKNGKTVIVDPGHGFRDPGCGAANYELGAGKDERYVTLLVAGYLKEELSLLGYDVIMTHEGESNPQIEKYLDDNYFEPNERVDLVRSLNGDYFISLHCDIFSDPEINGLKFYYFDNDLKVNHDSSVIAQNMIDEYVKAFPDAKTPDLIAGKYGQEAGNYAVIRDITLPSSLVEMGFVSSPIDAANMLDTEWQKGFARSVARGIDKYFYPDNYENTEDADSTDTSVNS